LLTLTASSWAPNGPGAGKAIAANTGNDHGNLTASERSAHRLAK